MLEEGSIKQILDQAYERLSSEYLNTSVLSVVRSYVPRNPSDMELWALFCALLDYRIPVMSRLVPTLSEFGHYFQINGFKFIDLISNYDVARNIVMGYEAANKARGKGLSSHPNVTIEAILELFKALKDILNTYSSIGKLAQDVYEQSKRNLIGQPFQQIANKLAQEIRQRTPNLLQQARTKSLLPDPSKSSVLKRFCLYIRWMSRPYPDLDLWRFLAKEDLLVSLDRNVLRSFNRAFECSLPEKYTWENVYAITDFLKHINPEDPIKYDYVLSRPGIMGYCQEEPTKNRCHLCPLMVLCRFETRHPEVDGQVLGSPKEEEIFQRFTRQYGQEFVKLIREYNLGTKRADAVGVRKDGKCWVFEIEEKLNYAALGQALTYKRLCIEIYKKFPVPVIVCEKSDASLEGVCKIDAGIKVILV